MDFSLQSVPCVLSFHTGTTAAARNHLKHPRNPVFPCNCLGKLHSNHLLLKDYRSHSISSLQTLHPLLFSKLSLTVWIFSLCVRWTRAWMCWSRVQTAVGRVLCFVSSVDCGQFMEESCTAQNHSTCSTSHRGTTTTTTTIVPPRTHSSGSTYRTTTALLTTLYSDEVLCTEQALHVRGEPQRPGDLSRFCGGHGSEGDHWFRSRRNPSHCSSGLYPGSRTRWVCICGTGSRIRCVRMKLFPTAGVEVVTVDQSWLWLQKSLMLVVDIYCFKNLSGNN